MDTQTKHNIFEQQIAEVYQRTTALFKTSEQSSTQPQLVLECLEELRIALEELHVAEEELRQQNEQLIEAREAAEIERYRYQELFEFAPDGYLVTSLSGMVLEANQAAASLLNIAKKYLVGKPITNFVPEQNRSSFRSMLNQLPTISRIQEWEVCLARRNADVIDAALTVEVVQDPTGQVVALRWLLRDITARKQAEEQLQQIQLQNLHLLEVDRLKSQFMATLSHELRTPLNAILGFSQLLLRQFHNHYPPEQLSMLERIIRNGRHLLIMIEEMLDFSKLQANRLELRLESFNLSELALSTVEELQLLAEQKALQIKVSVPPELFVINDVSRLRQILVNLLSNAIKFTDEGSIELDVCLLPEERVMLVIKDTGIGIEPADQPRVFQAFWQVNQTTQRQHGGTGLGLSIVHSLVHLMHGSITVESQPKVGTTFRVELPRHMINAVT